MGTQHALLDRATTVWHWILRTVLGEGSAWRILRLVPVERARAIWTGRHTHAAAYTPAVVNKDDPLGVPVCGTYGTNVETWRVLALETWAGHEKSTTVLFDLKDPDPFLTFRNEVLCVTCFSALRWLVLGDTAFTLAQINHHCPLAHFPIADCCARHRWAAIRETSPLRGSPQRCDRCADSEHAPRQSLKQAASAECASVTLPGVRRHTRRGMRGARRLCRLWTSVSEHGTHPLLSWPTRDKWLDTYCYKCVLSHAVCHQRRRVFPNT